MSRTPRIPPELMRGPFTLSQAREAGLTLSSLRGKAWTRLGTELYCWTGSGVNPWTLLSAWQSLLPPEAVFAGKTAGWLLGLDMAPTDPVDVIVPASSGVRSRRGLNVRRSEVATAETARVRGMSTTTIHRALLDLCLQLPPLDALIAIDMAINAGITDAVALGRYAAQAKGRPGAGRLLVLSTLGSRAESPMETRLRWLLREAGLPHPEVQAELRDSDGRFVGRADLYYPEARLVIEYDGANHRDRLVQDDRRQNLLINAGFLLLRFTAADIYQRPDVVAAQVRSALVARRSIRTFPTKRAHSPSARSRLVPKARNQPRLWSRVRRALARA